MPIQYAADPFPSNQDMNALFAQVWDRSEPADFNRVLSRSLVHVAAYNHEKLIGFVNVATDGGIHAFLVDTTVLPEYQHQGIGRRLVRIATDLSRQRGAQWLHVDYELHLERFYAKCGFRHTGAGLIDLTEKRDE